MSWASLAALWHAHQKLCVLVGSALVLLLAWLGVRWDYGQGSYQAPVRWYMGYTPPPFAEPGRWDIQELNTSTSLPTADPTCESQRHRCPDPICRLNTHARLPGAAAAWECRLQEMAAASETTISTPRSPAKGRLKAPKLDTSPCQTRCPVW